MVDTEAEAAADRTTTVQVETDIHLQISRLEKEMLAAAKDLEFERATELRDAIAYLKKWDLGLAS